MTTESQGDARQLAMDRYLVDTWGSRYFTVDDEGFARVIPDQTTTNSVRLEAVIAELRSRGYRAPYLLRFPQILKDRVARLHNAFAAAIAEFEYPGSYQGVYPVKVNQQKVVVESLAEESHRFKYGLEVGSKGELILALTQELHPDALIICNGFKDRDYIELALRGAQAGSRVILICETLYEVAEVVTTAREINIVPAIGVRARLDSRGAGRWVESGGSHAKFGLSTLEILECIRLLEREGCIEILRCLHFHIGSQIADILAIKEAVKEAARLYCQVKKLASSLDILDMGGGLGVDYDGSNTASDWSRNYDLEEYCRDCVYNVQSVCEQEDMTPPLLVSESGRAVTAHHAVVVVSPLKLIGRMDGDPIPMPDDPCHQVVDLAATLEDIHADNWREFANDAKALHEELIQGFKLGFVTLEDRAAGEALFTDICRRALALLDPEEEDEEEVAELRSVVAPILVCNFSVFQSTPDTWALRQVFPIIPLAGLTAKTTMPVSLGDITCDSDGRIDDFLGENGSCQKTMIMPLLENGPPEHIGIFLVGAYQDTLGDFHNLFGAPNEISLWVDGPDEFRVVRQHRGTTVSEAMSLFSFTRQELMSRFDDQLGGEDTPDAIRYRDCFLRVLSSGTYLRR